MNQLNETDKLNEAIILVKNKRTLQLKIVKEQLHVTFESLKPINLIKNAFQEVTKSPELKSNILNNVIGLTTGYLSKKVIVGASHNPIKKLWGTFLQLVITSFVARHSDAVISAGENLYQRFKKHSNNFN